MRCERGHQVTVPLNTTGVIYYVEGCPGFMLGWMIEGEPAEHRFSSPDALAVFTRCKLRLMTRLQIGRLSRCMRRCPRTLEDNLDRVSACKFRYQKHYTMTRYTDRLDIDYPGHSESLGAVAHRISNVHFAGIDSLILVEPHRDIHKFADLEESRNNLLRLDFGIWTQVHIRFQLVRRCFRKTIGSPHTHTVYSHRSSRIHRHRCILHLHS